jgi:hypothetical protein
MGKEKKQICQGSSSIGFLLDHKSLKLVFLMWKEVSHVVSFQALSKGCELDK